MNIGEAARESGVSQRMIRHYEKLGMIPEASRQSSGYREYHAADVQRLRFIADARAVGMPLDEIADLLSLWTDADMSLECVAAAASSCVARLDERAGQIERVKAALMDLAARTELGSRPEYPVMPQS